MLLQRAQQYSTMEQQNLRARVVLDVIAPQNCGRGLGTSLSDLSRLQAVLSAERHVSRTEYDCLSACGVSLRLKGYDRQGSRRQAAHKDFARVTWRLAYVSLFLSGTIVVVVLNQSVVVCGAHEMRSARVGSAFNGRPARLLPAIETVAHRLSDAALRAGVRGAGRLLPWHTGSVLDANIDLRHGCRNHESQEPQACAVSPTIAKG